MSGLEVELEGLSSSLTTRAAIDHIRTKIVSSTATNKQNNKKRKDERGEINKGLLR